MPRTKKHVTRFITTGLPRVGTNLIHHSLAGHPEVLAYNEIFNKDNMLWGSGQADIEMGETFRNFRDQRPLAFIEHVLAPDLPEITAVGFKLFYMQGGYEEPEKFKLVWPYLRRMKGLKVVDVVRDNRLKQAFSWIQARRTDVWLQKNQDKPSPQQPITIPFAELDGYFHWFERIFGLREECLRGMDAIVVHYEELAKDFTAQMDRIQRHMGVPVRPLKPETRKQRTLPISQAIANYAELRVRFAGTPSLKYFEMAEESARCRVATA